MMDGYYDGANVHIVVSLVVPEIFCTSWMDMSIEIMVLKIGSLNMNMCTC